MNQTIQKLFDRKSVRAYSDEIITPEEKEWILKSALQGTDSRQYGSLFYY